MSKSKTARLVIRKASLKDVGIVLKIQKNDGYNHSYYLTRERLRGLFERGELFFIAFLDNEAAGFVSVDIEIRARIHFLSVMQEKQKNGTGTALLEKIISEAKKRKVKMVYVYTEAGSMLENFLKKKDFKKVGFFQDKFGKNKHANIFSRNL